MDSTSQDRESRIQLVPPSRTADYPDLKEHADPTVYDLGPHVDVSWVPLNFS